MISERRSKLERQRAERQRNEIENMYSPEQTEQLAQAIAARTSLPVQLLMQNPQLLHKMASNPALSGNILENTAQAQKEALANRDFESSPVQKFPSAAIGRTDVPTISQEAPTSLASGSAVTTPEQIGAEIAQKKVGYSPMTQQLIDMNNISNPDLIHPGQVLKTPGEGTYTVKKGDYLSGIGQRMALEQQAANAEKTKVQENILPNQEEPSSWGGSVMKSIGDFFSRPPTRNEAGLTAWEERARKREAHGLGH